MLEYFRMFCFATITTIVLLVLVTYYLGWDAALLAVFLVVLEVSLSFDNAVVNAKVLANMSRFWQNIFLTIGIIIAVFGVRIFLPIFIVAAVATLPFGEVVSLAINRPDEYERYLDEAQPLIAAFGGMFLLLVFLEFFILDNNRRTWLRPIETAFRRLPRHWLMPPAIAFVILALVASTTAHVFNVLVAGLIGIAVFVVMHGFVRFMEARHRLAGKATKLTGVAGFSAFLYLEALDASFSLDSVVGAFAITSSVVLIAAGLGAGAVWIRSMTIFLVRHRTLGKYRYLEHGAHYAIGVLAAVLLLSFFFHVPEVITGTGGLLIIIASIVGSIRKSRQLKQLKRPRSAS